MAVQYTLSTTSAKSWDGIWSETPYLDYVLSASVQRRLPVTLKEIVVSLFFTQTSPKKRFKCRTKQDKTIINYRLKTSAWKRNLWQPLFIFFQFVTAMVVLLMVFSMAVIPATTFRIRRNATEPAINGCVKRWSRHPGANGDVLVAECKKHSFACLHSITKFGFPKCKPVYKIISLLKSSGTKGTRHARVVVNCSCGWVHK